MYEKFSDRARKVMQLANQEAMRFNHEYIGTEHILLGIVKEGAGIAAMALGNLHVDLRKIRLEVEKIVQAGPDMITLGKLPNTPRAKQAIKYAMEESQTLKHTYVGTEHLLLGLIRVTDGVASVVLTNLGVTADAVREQIAILLPTRKESKDTGSWVTIRLEKQHERVVELTPLQKWVDVELLKSVLVALETGLEHAREVLRVHETNLGRTTRKNKFWGETLDADIELISVAMESVKKNLPE